MTCKRKKSPRWQEEDLGIYCPTCKSLLSSQYDTQAEEPFWHCWECEQSYDIDGVTPTVYMTNVPER